MNRNDEILRFIKTIRESFGASIAVYTMGNCYQFYEILKNLYGDAEPYSNGHVYTKIDNKFYDIKGEANFSEEEILHFKKVESDNDIQSLSVNKWTDERRMKLLEENTENIKKMRGD